MKRIPCRRCRLIKTVRTALDEAASRLKGITERPRFESERLLSYVLEKERVYLHAHPEFGFESERFDQLVEKRALHEPLEYLTGSAGFFGREFHVRNGVLIPRPETEILVEKTSERIRQEDCTVIAEIGTGGGIISVMLALLHPNLRLIATDISETALDVARVNAKKHGVESRITFIQTSLLDGISEKICGIVSNPPYIAQDYTLPENLSYEPKEALFGGERGDEVLHAIMDLAWEREVSFLGCEMGYDQRDSIRGHVSERNPRMFEIYTDLAGLDRGFIMRL